MDEKSRTLMGTRKKRKRKKKEEGGRGRLCNANRTFEKHTVRDQQRLGREKEASWDVKLREGSSGMAE